MSFKPYFPDVDQGKLQHDVARLVGSDTFANYLIGQYRQIEEYYKGYPGLKQLKTLSSHEASVLFATLAAYRASPIVEIGTQYGQSTRRIIDMADALDFDRKPICFDVEYQVRHFKTGEATVVLDDVTGRFRESVIETYRPRLVFLDAHPYHLVREVVAEFMTRPEWILVVHDCGPGLCNPRTPITVNDPRITSKTGHWERHVLAELHGISDPLSPEINHIRTDDYEMIVFDTEHGIAVLKPLSMDH